MEDGTYVMSFEHYSTNLDDINQGGRTEYAIPTLGLVLDSRAFSESLTRESPSLVPLWFHRSREERC